MSTYSEAVQTLAAELGVSADGLTVASALRARANELRHGESEDPALALRREAIQLVEVLADKITAAEVSVADPTLAAQHSGVAVQRAAEVLPMLRALSTRPAPVPATPTTQAPSSITD